ncbi:ketoacyl reductase [Phaffia rhodozyma]|uniref:Very-long-chain 3-oxoacyl-CoA reductase n=1 Tax=Phaffia rhodozyma TaxID=264483 RepID=A0A0F7SVB2_PHARH|nr:ketoacyl reductase [Phaffia rhodozyma]
MLVDTFLEYPTASTFLASIGSLFVLVQAYNLLKLVAQLTLIKGTNLTKYGAGKGSWAAITGSTGDLGIEFARQMAKKGFNIVLIGRNHDKLEAIGQEIRIKYKVTTKEVVIDFGNPQPEAFEELKSLASDLEINVLVNCAGLSHEMPVYFTETSQDEMLGIVDVNIKATLLTTQALLPAMVSRHNGLVLTVGSFSALVPSAMLATYTGSKAFLERWSQALGEEVEEFGVDVQLVLPYFVVSAMSKIRRSSVLIPLASDFVKSTLSSIGLSRGAVSRPFTMTPYWSHALFDWALATFALGGRFAMGKGLAMHKDIRRRALAKKARLAKSE